MEREIEITGKISEDFSCIEIDNWQGLTRITRMFKDKVLHVKLKVFRKTRSLAQNRYIHGVIVPTVMAWHKESQGERKTHDEIYVWLRAGILGHKVIVTDVLGTEVLTMDGKRFSQMNTKEFTDAVETIIEELAIMGCYVEKPKENNMLSDYARDYN